MPVAMTKGGQRYYLAYDQVGTLRAVTDASGNAVKRIGYDTFGNVISDSNTAFAVPFGFAGGLYDADTGLIRFGYRDYDPDTGRWTAKDPIGFAGGDTDLYGYCLGDPVNWADPEGLRIQLMGTPEQQQYILSQLRQFIYGSLSFNEQGMLSRTPCDNDGSIEADIDELILSENLYRIFAHLSENGWGRSSTVPTNTGADIYFDPDVNANYPSGFLSTSPITPAAELAHELGRATQIQKGEAHGRYGTETRRRSNENAVKRANRAFKRMGMKPRTQY
ncbi:hypothetical protein DENIS_0888 [Desulfonema ishimotonii]|uniref:Teneurin-like YD-shell domain-containing protein n=1 Tax=Desulfonema ishimotonii TaxID=45657 RepID=A0A401FSL2_9BACT|nr:RHS repeat-associated core domain-containing protein [Desulfonema ishimotonii]GBC59946.1 hypothetical protein DENIS_0888 [Desulfonema ishimotonii]